MKSLMCAVALAILTVSSQAGDYVGGYLRSNGTYVSGYNRTSPNSTVRDNYSYKGNYNPFTGNTGSNYYRNSPSSAYYNGGYSSGSYGSGGYRYQFGR